MNEQDHIDHSQATHIAEDAKQMTTPALEWLAHELEVELRERDETRAAISQRVAG